MASARYGWDHPPLEHTKRGIKKVLKGHTPDDGGCTIAFSPDLTTVAGTGGGGNVFVAWDVRTGSARNSLTKPYGQLLGVCFSPDGSALVTAQGGPENSLQIYDAATREFRKKLSGA